MTRSDGAAELHNKMQAGMEWTDQQVQETQAFSDKTHRVHVTYNTLTTQDAKTDKTSQASMDEQTMAGLRVRPVRLARNSDRMVLTLRVQNTVNDTSGLAQTDEILAAFTFPDCLEELDDRACTGLITTINLHQRTKRT